MFPGNTGFSPAAHVTLAYDATRDFSLCCSCLHFFLSSSAFCSNSQKANKGGSKRCLSFLINTKGKNFNSMHSIHSLLCHLFLILTLCNGPKDAWLDLRMIHKNLYHFLPLFIILSHPVCCFVSTASNIHICIFPSWLSHYHFPHSVRLQESRFLPQCQHPPTAFFFHSHWARVLVSGLITGGPCISLTQ